MGVLLTFFVGSLALATDTVSVPLYCLDGSSDVRPAASSGSATPYDSCKALLPGCSSPVAGRAGGSSVAGLKTTLASFLKEQLKDQIALYIAGLYNGWQIDLTKTTVAPGADGVMEVKPVGAKKFTESVCSVVGWDYGKWRDSTWGDNGQAATLAELENEKFTGTNRPCGKPPVLLSDDEQKNIQFKIGTQGGGRVSAYLNGAAIFAIKRMLAETNAKIDEATKSGGAGKIDIDSECAPSVESLNLVHNGAAAALTQMNASSMNSCSAITELGSASLCGQPTDILGQNLVPLCGLRNSVQSAHAGLVGAISCHTIKGASKLFDHMFRSLMTDVDSDPTKIPTYPSYLSPIIAEIKAANPGSPAPHLQAGILREVLFYEAGKSATTRVRGDSSQGGWWGTNLFRFRQRKAACWGAAVLALPAGVNNHEDYWQIVPHLSAGSQIPSSPDDPSTSDQDFVCRAATIGDSNSKADVALGIYLENDRWNEKKGEEQRRLVQNKSSAGEGRQRTVNGRFSRNNGLLGVIERQIFVMCRRSESKSGLPVNHCEELPYSWDVFKAKYGKYRWLAP